MAPARDKPQCGETLWSILLYSSIIQQWERVQYHKFVILQQQQYNPNQQGQSWSNSSQMTLSQPRRTRPPIAIESSPKQSSKCGQTTVNASANLQSTLTSQCWSKPWSNRGQHWLIWTMACKVEAPNTNPQSKVSLCWSTQSSSTSVNPSQRCCTFLYPPAPKSTLLFLPASSFHVRERCSSYTYPNKLGERRDVEMRWVC